MEKANLTATLAQERLLDAFESALRSGSFPRIETFVEQSDEEHREEIFVELLRIEMDAKRHLGIKLNVAEYYHRFPSKAELIAELFNERIKATDRYDAKRFTAIGRLGIGGQGEVWLAKDLKLGRHVAVKVLPEERMDAKSVARFRREAIVTANLEHPSIVPVYELPEEDVPSGLPFSKCLCYVMKVYGDQRLHIAMEAFHARSRTNEDYSLLNDLSDFERNRSDLIRDSIVKKLASFPGDTEIECDRRLRISIEAILSCDTDSGNLSKAIRKFHSGEWSIVELRNLLSRLLRVCEAVAFAHSRNVVHCDLKPENIMLGDFGETLVADWGLSKVIASPPESAVDFDQNPLIQNVAASSSSASGTVVGTLHYMSPEQALGRSAEIGPKSDVFSLGAILFRMLTGQTPAQSTARTRADSTTAPTKNSDAELYSAVCSADFPEAYQVEPKAPKALSAIARKALSKEPKDRYETVLDVHADIQRWLNDQPVLACPEPPSIRVKRWMNSHARFLAATAAAMIVATISLSALLIVVNLQKSELAKSLEREGEQRERAVTAAVLADKNAQSAREQTRLALSTINSVVTELQQSLKNVPASTAIRNRILAQSFQSLEKIATEFAADAAVDRITMIGLLELADTVLILGMAESEVPAVSLFDVMVKDSRDAAQLNNSAVEFSNKLVAHALTLAEQLAADSPADPVASSDLATVLERVGEISMQLGKSVEALASFKRALGTRRLLHENDRSNPRSVHDLGICLAKLGQSNLDMRQYDVAMSLFHERLLLQRAQIELQPSDLGVKQDLASALDQYASVLFRMGKSEASLNACREGLSLRSASASKTPDDERSQRDLSVSYLTVGLLLEETGNFADALNNIETGIEIRRHLAELDPSNRNRSLDLAHAYHCCIPLLQKFGRFSEASDNADVALDICRKLVVDDPSNRLHRRTLSVSLEKKGISLMELGQFHEALQIYEEGKAHAIELRNEDPDNLARQSDVAIWLERIVDAQTKLNKFDDALSKSTELLEIHRNLARLSPNAESQRKLGLTLSNRGKLHALLGRMDSACANYEEAFKIHRELAKLDPNSAIKRRDVFAVLNSYGTQLIALDRKTEGLQHLLEALQYSRSLLTMNPESDSAQKDFLSCIYQVGKAHQALDQVSEAILCFQERLEFVIALAADKQNVTWRLREVMVGYNLVGSAYMVENEFDLAKEQFVKGIEVLTTMISNGQQVSESRQAIRFLQERIHSCENANIATGDWETLIERRSAMDFEALLAFRKNFYFKRGKLDEVFRIAQTLHQSEPRSIRAMYDAACGYSLCAELAQKKPEFRAASDQTSSQMCLDASFECLNELLAMGFQNFGLLRRDSDLKALRAMPEFEQLLYRE